MEAIDRPGEGGPSRRRYALALFLILLACYAYFLPAIHNWGSNSRMDLVYAVGDLGVLHIDDYHGNTGDKAFFEGHFYSEKSIGPSLVALPFYLAFRGLTAVPPGEWLLGLRDYPDPGPEMGHPFDYHAAATTFVTSFAVAVPSAVLGAVVFLLAARFARRDAHAFWLALAFGLGTMAFAYANELFQHQPAAFGAFVGFFCLWRVVREGAGRGWLWGAGALLGLAVISEYSTVLLAGAVVLWGLAEGLGWRGLGRVVAGAVPFGAVTVTYNLAAFRSPLPVGYAHTVYFSEVHERGFMGLGWPDPAVLGYWLTVSPFRGLFFLSPFLVLGLAGLVLMWRADRRLRGTVVLVAAVVAGFFLYNASFWVWWGGASVGPRHLIPMVPFLALPAVLVLDRWLPLLGGRAAFAVLAGVSSVNVWAQSIAGTDFPPERGGVTEVIPDNPLWDYALPALARGEIRPNYGWLLGLSGLWSVVPLAVGVGVVAWAILARSSPWGPGAGR